MLSPSGLFWTQFAAAIGWLIVGSQLYHLWKIRMNVAASRTWAVVRGVVTASTIEVPDTHTTDDRHDTRAIIHYRYNVGGKDYEGSRVQFGDEILMRRLDAEAMVRKYPVGLRTDVHFEPSNPANAALCAKAGKGVIATVIFFIVFAAITGVLTAHAIAGKMLMMPSGLPYFALLLPLSALALAAACVYGYFVQRRKARESLEWPSVEGEILAAEVDTETVREEDNNGKSRTVTRYRADVRFAYRIGDHDYISDTLTSDGMPDVHASSRDADETASRYRVGQKVTVHYDPKKPNAGILERGNTDVATALLAVGAFVGIIGTLFLLAFTQLHWVPANG
jgi:hypothetical protein